MTKAQINRVIYDLNAIAQYAERARDALGETEIGTGADKAAMQQTWILQAVKSALHAINGLNVDGSKFRTSPDGVLVLGFADEC